MANGLTQPTVGLRGGVVVFGVAGTDTLFEDRKLGLGGSVLHHVVEDGPVHRVQPLAKGLVGGATEERELGAGITFEDIHDEVAGVYPRVMQQGELDAGAWSCGMVAGLVYDIPSVRELIDRIMGEAETIIRKRLEGFLSA